MATNQVPDNILADFANMSAALTGFQASILRPFLDPVNLSGLYYGFAVSQVGQQAMDALLNAYRAIATQPAQTIADTLLETASSTPSQQAQIAQSIVAVWYLGSWYMPAYQNPQGQPGAVVQVVSMDAYTNGLAWKVAQAHPMGYSVFTFGYWSQPPASLATFGVNVSNGGGQ
jgi:acetyl-CoA acetyltransferase